MDTDVKLAILADAAKYDASCASSGSKRSNQGKGLGNAPGCGVCHSFTPDGRCISLLKLLLTNFCIYDCQYCVNRISNDVRRARFGIDEVVELTVSFYKRNYIEGLFLSSGVIRDPDYTMDQLAEVARRLRMNYRFGGYIHLKAVVGASPEAVLRAGRHADRLSANLELPKQADLDRLAPGKSIIATEHTMREIKTNIVEAKEAKAKSKRSTSLKPVLTVPRFAPAGQSTQMVIGASPATDSQVLSAADRMYRQHDLRRVYYSAYSPIPNAPTVMPHESPPLLREHRLYQADWLLRFYGFDLDEIVEDEQNLSLEVDPKLAWALRHREQFPVDLNTASRELVLRVPGLGVRNVGRIVRMRRQSAVRQRDLKVLRVPKRAYPFVITQDGHAGTRHLDQPNLKQKLTAPPTQLSLFDTTHSALTGEV